MLMDGDFHLYKIYTGEINIVETLQKPYLTRKKGKLFARKMLNINQKDMVLRLL